VTPSIKLGFLGFGIMGERLLRAGLAHDKATIIVTGAFDPRAGAAARLKAIDPALTAFDSADAVIAASDALHIASPPLSHLDYLDRCARAGKAALCEKPLATDVAAATAIVRDLAARNMRAGVNFPFASSFAVDQLQAWINDGTVGTPQRVDITMEFGQWPRSWQMDAISWLDGRAEGGFLREVGSHLLFLTHRLIGPLSLTSAKTSYPADDRSERSVDASLASGAVAVQLTGRVSASGPVDHNMWTLSGTHGCIRLRDWSFAEREIGGVWQTAPSAVTSEAARPLVFARQLDKIAAMTRGQPTSLATLAEALHVQTVVEAILAQ
jgi:predicted dehydrogenase